MYAEAEPLKIRYCDEIERAIDMVEPEVIRAADGMISSRWLALRLIDGDGSLLKSLEEFMGFDILDFGEVEQKVRQARRFLESSGIPGDKLRDKIVSGIIEQCEYIYGQTVSIEKKDYAERDRKIDRILTSKLTGIPIMLVLLCVFWITITEQITRPACWPTACSG